MNLTVNRFILEIGKKSLNPAAVGCLFFQGKLLHRQAFNPICRKISQNISKKMKFYIVDIQYIKNQNEFFSKKNAFRWLDLRVKWYKCIEGQHTD